MEGSAKRKVETICMTVLGLAVAGLMVFPIIWLGFSSFKPSSELFAYPLHLFPQAPTGESYISVVADGFFNYVKNSLFLAVVGTVITVVISAMCGYALAIYRKEIPYVNKVFAVFRLFELPAEQKQLFRRNPALTPCDFFDATDIKTLTVLNGGNKVGGFQQTVTVTGIEPCKSTSEKFHFQRVFFQIEAV